DGIRGFHVTGVQTCALPISLAELAAAQKQWEALPEAVRPRVLFVSVDPERDTPAKAGEYAHAFHPDTLAATADVPALEKFATSLDRKSVVEGTTRGLRATRA